MMLIMRGLREMATADEAVKTRLLPKYRYVSRIRVLTTSGHKLSKHQQKKDYGPVINYGERGGAT